MFRRFRLRTLPIALVVVLIVAVAGSPAAALPNNTFYNGSGYPVTYTYGTGTLGSGGWCENGNVYVWYGEEMSCVNTARAEVAGGGNWTPSNRDADSIRYDANCTTIVSINGTWQPAVNRQNLGSYYQRFSYPTNVSIIDKQCYPPSNFVSGANSTTSISLGWSVVPGASYRLYRGSTQIGGTLPPGTSSYLDTGLQPGTSYSYSIRMVRGSYQTGAAYTSRSTLSDQISPTYQPSYSGNYYWVTTFATATGYYPYGQAAGEMWAATNFVYCKAQAGTFYGTYGYNNLWLWALLDSPQGVYGWVSAYYLSNWGNNQAYTDSGGEIEWCTH
jgi:hypothetical protein